MATDLKLLIYMLSLYTITRRTQDRLTFIVRKHHLQTLTATCRSLLSTTVSVADTDIKTTGGTAGDSRADGSPGHAACISCQVEKLVEIAAVRFMVKLPKQSQLMLIKVLVTFH